MVFLATITLIYIYYPIAQIYFFPTHLTQITVTKNEFSISIPKISAYSPIIKNVDPLDEKKYLEALKKGVAHAKGFGTPESTHSIFLFAHSSDFPWNITRYNTAFFRLNELKENDLITLTYNTKVYNYRVKEIKTVWPNQVDVVNNSKHKLILQTCTPIGTSLQRLLIFAD